MDNKIFEMELPKKKNSKEFDLALLEQIKTLKNIPVDEFDDLMIKIMKRKSNCILWWSNKPVREWDGGRYRKSNYRCCPSSPNANYYFCLQLDRQETGITVIDGFLREI